MSAPIALTPVDQPTVARSTATAEQVAALIAAIAGANVITPPAGKDFADVRAFSITLRQDGSAFINSSFQ